MKVIALVAVMAAILLSVSPAVAQGTTPATYFLDLAGGDKTTAVENRQAFSFQVIDKVPASVAKYSVSFVIVDDQPPQLVLPGAAPVAAGSSQAANAAEVMKKLQGAQATAKDNVDCTTPLATLTASLQAAKNEGGVQAVIAADRTDPTCAPQSLIALLTKDDPQPMQLKAGQTATITVTRPALTGENASPTWTFKFVSSPKGEFLTHYGFSFLGNRDKAFTAVAVQGSSPAQYRIVPSAKRNNIQYLPSFTFTYLPAYFLHRGWGLGPTAGLGTDLSNVTAFLGGAATFGENVNAYVGLAAAKQQRLNGKYHSQDVVMDNLSDDQINEKVYVPTIVFGVGFRFSSNPFTSNSTQPAPAAQPAKPASGSQ